MQEFRISSKEPFTVLAVDDYLTLMDIIKQFSEADESTDQVTLEALIDQSKAIFTRVIYSIPARTSVAKKEESSK